MRIATCFGAVFFLIFAGTVAKAQEIRQPGGGVDSLPNMTALSSDRKTLYVVRPDERLMALNLETGKDNWQSAEKVKPLAARGDVICVLINDKASSVRFAAMDAKSGKISKQSDSYALPVTERNVIVDPGSTGKQFFAGLTRKDKADKSFLGTLFFDPIVGKLELKDTKMGTAVIGAGRLPKLEKPNIPPMNYQTQPGFISGNRYIQVFYGRNTMTANVFGVHWDRTTGKFLEAKELFVNRRGNAIGTVAPVAAGRFVILAPPGEKGAYFSPESGKKLTAIPKNTQFGYVAGPVVLGIERPAGAKTATLHAFNMTADKLVWSQPCHELTGR